MVLYTHLEIIHVSIWHHSELSILIFTGFLSSIMVLTGFKVGRLCQGVTQSSCFGSLKLDSAALALSPPNTASIITHRGPFLSPLDYIQIKRESWGSPKMLPGTYLAQVETLRWRHLSKLLMALHSSGLLVAFQKSGWPIVNAVCSEFKVHSDRRCRGVKFHSS